mgnify:CR=1 FL=1
MSVLFGGADSDGNEMMFRTSLQSVCQIQVQYVVVTKVSAHRKSVSSGSLECLASEIFCLLWMEVVALVQNYCSLQYLLVPAVWYRHLHYDRRSVVVEQVIKFSGTLVRTSVVEEG